MLGGHTVLGLQEFRVDKAFLSVAGVTINDGVTEYTERELLTVRSAMDIARKVYLLCDSSKFSTVALMRVCDLSRIYGIVADWKLTGRMQEAFEERGIRVIRALREG